MVHLLLSNRNALDCAPLTRNKMLFSLVLLNFFLHSILAAVSGTSRCSNSLRPGPVEFSVTLTEAFIAPDGYTRKATLMNGQFPGPALELCQGDDVVFTVENVLHYSITVHFHGKARNLEYSRA